MTAGADPAPARRTPARTVTVLTLGLLVAGTLGLSSPVVAVAQQPSADTLTLEEAVSTALAGDPDLAAAGADVSAARGARWADWGALLPTASAGASFRRSDFTNVTFVAPEGVSRRLEDPIESTSKTTNQFLSFDWTLLEGGRRIAGLSAGADQLEAAALRRSLAERTTVAEVKSAYFEARKQERLAALARDELEARREDLERTRERYRMAAVGRSDLLGAEAELEEARLALLDAEDLARQQKRALQVAMGVAPGAVPPLAPVPEPPDAADLDPAALVDRALAEHPELAALEAEAEAASSNLWAARSRYLPTLSLGFGFSRSESLGPEGDLFVFDPQNTGQSFSVTASWNLFDGFSRREEAASASAQLTRARADRAKRRLELEQEVRDRVSDLRRRTERLEILRSLVEKSRQRLELTREQYRLGTADYLELRTATEELVSAERRLMQERYDVLVLWAELEQRVGAAAADGAP